MRRRDFLGALSATAVWAGAARAQQPGRVPRIGMLWVESAEEERRVGFIAILRDALRDLGYVDGRTAEIEERFGDGDFARLSEAARELVGLNVNVIVTGAQGAIAAAQATKSIPIVSATTADPIGEGLAASLAHPGGNFTGNAVFFPLIMAKRLELLKEIAPSMRRAGVLAGDDGPFGRHVFDVMSETAKTLGVELRLFSAADAQSYGRTFAAASEAGISGLVILDFPNFFHDFPLLANLAIERRLLVGAAPPFARVGGLIGYGVVFPELWRKAATFVDKILKGAKAGDIPIEQATRFETIVNLKAAVALGVEIPPTLLAAASEAIE